MNQTTNPSSVPHHLRPEFLAAVPPPAYPRRVAYLLPEGPELDYYHPIQLTFGRHADIAPPPWPFVDGFAPTSEDWKAAGFQVLDFR